MTSSLLCTLGSSWAVVPEAFLLGSGPPGYDRVVVVTTSSPPTAEAARKVETWFADHAPAASIRILAIEHLADINSADDHQRFETAFYRAYFDLLDSAQELHVCLAGGFKTMSATAQEAAGLLGCGKLFHVTAPFGLKTDTDADLRAAIADGRIRMIDLGERAGWPTIRELRSEAEPLPPAGDSFLVEDHSLSNAIHHRLEAANRLAASEPELATLPFPQLARWAPGERAALDRPLDPSPRGADHAWLRALPKIELHCHLGGFATHGPELAAVRAAATDAAALAPIQAHCRPPAGWPLPRDPIGLESYRPLGDNNGSAILRDPGCLEKHIELLCDHLRVQNIRYAEIRCSPANYAGPGRSPWTVLTEIISHFDRFAHADPAAPALKVNLILIATRRSEGDYRTAIARHLTLAVTAAEEWTDPGGCRVVGVDLAGFEDPTTRAHYFRDDFRLAHRAGLALTVHAGEVDEAEAIWSAVFDLSAMRLGHALSLRQSPDLMRSIAARRIAVEMCPYANFQIKGFPLDEHAAAAPPATRYPLLDYLSANIPVTVNTDNIGISAASLTDNFLLLGRLCPGITRLDILRLVRHSIDHAFLDAGARQRLLADFHLPPAP